MTHPKDSTSPAEGAHEPTHAVAGEQSTKTVLDRELPKGSSLADRTPNGGVISTSSSSNRSKGAKRSTDKVNFNVGKNSSAIRLSPVPKAALTPLEPAPVPSICVPPVSLSSRVFPMQGTHSAIDMRRVLSGMNHHGINMPS